MAKLNNTIKLVGLGVALATAGQAQALNLGGIEVDAGAHFEVASVYENAVFAVGDVLTGYGEVSSINGSGDFCAGGAFSCELTYQFGGYVVTSIAPGAISFSGGWVNFYADSTPEFNPFTSSGAVEDIAEVTDGTLWLTLAGHANPVSTLAGTGAFIGTTDAIGSGGGLLDIDFTGAANGNAAGAGALANSNFDTDSEADLSGGFADMTFTSSFGTSTPPHAGIDLAGSADMRGKVIPEPASLALLGIGLLGLGASAMRRRNSSK